MQIEDVEATFTANVANNNDVMIELAFNQFIFRGYLTITDAETFLRVLTAAVTQARGRT